MNTVEKLVECKIIIVEKFLCVYFLLQGKDGQKKTKKASSGWEEYDKEKSRHYEMHEMKLHQSEMRCQSRQSHQIKEIEDATLVTHNDNPIDMNRQEILRHHNEKIRDLKKSILTNGDASTSESQGTYKEHIYEKMCFNNSERSKKMPNDKFPIDTNIDYMHSPNNHTDSKSFNSHRYNKHLLENSPLTSCQGVNTEEQRIHQNTSFQDDQYDDNLLYANEDTNYDQTVLNNPGSAAEKGLFCVTYRGTISVC